MSANAVPPLSTRADDAAGSTPLSRPADVRGGDRDAPQLTVLLPVIDERDNLALLLPRLGRVLRALGCSAEVLVVDGGSRDGTAAVAEQLGARVLMQRDPGFGAAMREGFAAARGEFVLTLDADLSHDPDFIGKLWRARDRADLVVASRYVTGGVAVMPWRRRVLSRMLNRFLGIGLALPVRDLSSGFRLYRRALLDELIISSRNFEVQPETLVKAYTAGWRVLELPFTYFPRQHGSSHARVVRFGIDFLRAFARLWVLRNSIATADYDERAFYSRNPLQRFWQRRRHRIVTAMVRGQGRTLDVGCGSSVIVQSLNDAVGVDLHPSRLRYMRRYGVPLVRASALALPIRGASIDCVVCSQVLQFIPAHLPVFAELVRVLRPGGLLVVGTPDYASLGWQLIEPLYRLATPGAAEEVPVARYTRAGVRELARMHGLEIVAMRYVLGSELIVALRKRA
jgi:dolichol-phosphate mannosyltransferase